MQVKGLVCDVNSHVMYLLVLFDIFGRLSLKLLLTLLHQFLCALIVPCQ